MRRIGIALALLCGAVVGYARAEEPGQPTVSGNSRLLLELWIDGRLNEVVAPVSIVDGHIIMRTQDLKAAGLQIDKTGETIDLSTLDGVTARIDEPNQRLLLSVRASKLATQRFDLQGSMDQGRSESATGAILRYDTSVLWSDFARSSRSVSGGATASLDVFTPYGFFTSSGFATSTGARFTAARLDTRLQFDRPGDMSHILVGDAISAGPGWTRGVRFGGIEWASDFAVRPDLVTMPLPVYFGQSQVPATIEVFSGTARVFEQNVQAGPFELRNLPIVTGGGTATVVTRDILGRQTVQNISLYTNASLLAPGLASYSVDAGFRRTGYGIDNLGYDTPVFSGTYRAGIDGNLTLQGHGEAAPQLGVLGGGAALSLGNVGIVSLDLAGSGGAAGSGMMAAFSGEARQGPFSFNASVVAAGQGFRDLASLGGAPPPQLRYSADVSTVLRAIGTFSVGWIGLKQTNFSSDYLTASYSVPLPSGAFVAFTALHDLNAHGFNAQISLMIPLGSRAMASVTGQASDGNGSVTAMYDAPAISDGGTGYRMMTRWDRNVRVEGGASWIGQNASLDGGVSVQGQQAAVRANATGALVAIGGTVFATHEPGNAVALVETGSAGVRVYRENREIGKSGADGKLLLTGLDAYAANHIAVDPRDYSFDAVVENPDRIVRPQRRSGVIVNLAPTAHHPLIAIVTSTFDTPIPAGARLVMPDNSAALIVGRSGEVFIPDLKQAADAVIRFGTTRCQVHIEPVARTGTAIPRTKPLPCLVQVANNAE